MNGNRRLRAILASLFLVMALALASCSQALMRLEGGPRAWVGGPPDGSEVPLGVVSAMCHAYASAGVSQIELWVNGVFANRAPNAGDPGAEYFTASLTFETTGPGSYVLHCWTYDQDGGSAQSEPVTVRVTGEEVPTPTEGGEVIPTATPTSTEAPPTATTVPPTGTTVPPTATSIPPTSTAVPPTSTSLPPTSTPQPISIISFEVSKSQINVGECVRFTWQVGGSPTAIFFDGEGVTSPDARDRCPTATREYELRAEGYGGPVTARLTVVVRGDTTGPSISNISESADPMTWPDAYCTYANYPNQVTISALVNDDSGVEAVKLTYRVVRGSVAGSWQALAMQLQRGGSYAVTVGPPDLERSMTQPAGQEQNGRLEYYIQAFDGLDNSENSPTYTVTILYCYKRIVT